MNPRSIVLASSIALVASAGGAAEPPGDGQAAATTATAASSSRARWQVVATPDDRRPRVVVLSSPERLAARGEPISLSVKDADLVEVVRSLAKIAGLNLILDPSVRGTVTAELVDVPWDQALAVILRINGLAMELDGRIITVAPPARLYAAP